MNLNNAIIFDNFSIHINGVIIERIATVLALVALVDLTQIFYIRHSSDDILRFSSVGMVAITVLLLSGLGIIMKLERLPGRLQKWRLVRGLGNLGSDTRHIFLSLSRFWKPIMWGILGHLNVSLAVFILAVG